MNKLINAVWTTFRLLHVFPKWKVWPAHCSYFSRVCPLRQGHLLLLLAVITLSACYSDKPKTSDAMPQHMARNYTTQQLDSISFSTTHHYTNNFNFVVKSDSMELLSQQPEEYLAGMPTDSFAARKNAHLVVADIRKIPSDSSDSIWVQLATENGQFGWIHESVMMKKVTPDDPISKFIDTFSNIHLLIFLIVIIVIALCYLVRAALRRNAHIVHFHDIETFYPTLLCLLVASSATLYGSIQLFTPDLWRHFYFHPTLNPFSVPLLLKVFLISVWAMLIVAIAAADDVFHLLRPAEALLYMAGLVAVCAIDYIVFSLTTLYYIGYVLLAAYIGFALWRYFHYGRAEYVCGNCGARMRHKGRCPVCGTMNE